MLNLPLSHSDFFSHYFEQKPLRCAAVVEPKLVDLSDVDALLNTLEPDERRLQLFLNGQVPPAEFLTDLYELGRHRKCVNKDGFYRLLQQGATLVINQAEDTSSTFKRLCTEIGQFTGQTTSSNAYLSFGGKGSFGKHWDTHDVFAVQLIGTKHWQLFEPSLPLPLSHQTSAKFPHAPPAQPSYECTLTAGDVLYIPRGWWHQVTPTDMESLHLSIGTYPPTVLDYLMWVCKNQLPQTLAARKTCPTQLNDPSIALALKHLAQLAIQPQNLDAFNSAQRGSTQQRGEFQTALMLNKDRISEDHWLSLNGFISADHSTGTVVLNELTVNLNLIGGLLIALLQYHGTLSWAEVRRQLDHIPEAHLCETALDLSRLELINIHKPRNLS
jgi:ribosomal protein L16 Arg81 hydroxylase